MKNLNSSFKRKSFGFTLIEILVVIAIISALAVLVSVALNPAQRLKDARDSRRVADVDSILTAIHQSIVDNKGSLPSNMPAAGQERQIGAGDNVDCATALTGGSCNTPADTACANLMTGSYNLAKYLKTMPIDPTGGTTFDADKTGYAVTVDANGLVTVKACGTEGTTDIEASR